VCVSVYDSGGSRLSTIIDTLRKFLLETLVKGGTSFDTVVCHTAIDTLCQVLEREQAQHGLESIQTVLNSFGNSLYALYTEYERHTSSTSDNPLASKRRVLGIVNKLIVTIRTIGKIVCHLNNDQV
jgi:hypothetical protein